MLTHHILYGVRHGLICRVNNQVAPVTATTLHGNRYLRGCWEMVFLLACFSNHSLGLSEIKLKNQACFLPLKTLMCHIISDGAPTSVEAF